MTQTLETDFMIVKTLFSSFFYDTNKHHIGINSNDILSPIKKKRGKKTDFCRDELIRDVLLWTPTHGRAEAGRPARTYIQQLSEDTGCCPEDLPRAMNDREEWRERVRDIRATSAI